MRLFVLVRQKTENDKTEVDFCFSFISFSSDKRQKTIKRKLIFVLRLFGLVRQKTENDETEVDFCFSLIFLACGKKTENDKTEVDFCFPFICLSLRKNRNDKMEVD